MKKFNDLLIESMNNCEYSKEGSSTKEKIIEDVYVYITTYYSSNRRGYRWLHIDINFETSNRIFAVYQTATLHEVQKTYYKKVENKFNKLVSILQGFKGADDIESILNFKAECKLGY